MFPVVGSEPFEEGAEGGHAGGDERKIVFDAAGVGKSVRRASCKGGGRD